MQPDSLDQQTYHVLASTQGWHGTVAQLAKLLATRLGQPEGSILEALRLDGRYTVARNTDQDSAERLRELLARMGISCTLETPTSGPETTPNTQSTQMGWGSHLHSSPGLPARPNSRDTRLDPNPSFAPPPRRPSSSDTRLDPTPTLMSPPRRPSSSDTRLDPNPFVEPPQGAPGDQWGDVDLRDLRGLLEQDPEGALPDEALPTDQSLRPRPPRPTSSFDTSFKAAWGGLVPQDGDEAEPVAELEGDPEVEALAPPSAASTPHGRPLSFAPERRPTPERQPTPARDLSPNESQSLVSSAGWEAILGGAPVQPASQDPSGAPASTPGERATGQWEVMIETDDSREAFTLEAPEPNTPQPATKVEAPPPQAASPRRVTPRPARYTPAPLLLGVQPPQGRPGPRPEHSPGRATVLAALLPGSGQVYNGQWMRGALVGLSSPLVLPWLWGVWDARRTAARIQAGQERPAQAGQIKHVAVYAVCALALGMVLVQGGRLLGRYAAQQYTKPRELSPQVLMERRLEARGSAEVEVERALYRANRQRSQAEEDFARSGGAEFKAEKPLEARRRSLQLLGESRVACSRSDFILCQQLAESALELDPSNKDAWSLIVKAREALTEAQRQER